ncbi:toxin [Moritella sp. 36]|uniref:SpvB/TcaC N-terminal domain-containing protein n=1 Tax=Moritella sp. 36 TaxID=2746233 RepID=UPI001BA875FB|nr:SpvB/TcaC N-terminal domain-containing protein [Moritella sp. 36]QUM88678.1 toxin [Moritella sp. 36]
MSQQTSDLVINAPQLPKQGGAIMSAQTTPGHAGPTGDMSFSIPFPVSQGRGFAPSLSLSYQTSQGNGAFGVGWNLPLMSIQRYSRKGVPNYDDTDLFIGPAGAILVALRDKRGAVITKERNKLGLISFDVTYKVTTYCSNVADGYERYEQWQQTDALHKIFWLVFGQDGTLHCLGKSSVAQTGDENDIAEWSIEESVSPNGEHIHYEYTSENNEGVVDSQSENVRERGALSYLTHVFYGNLHPDPSLYCLSKKEQDKQHDWLFSVALDYGQRAADPDIIPAWRSEEQPWGVRSDSFSSYSYGFEVRCHRLCRQVILFHHYPDGFSDRVSAAPLGVCRLLFNYNENPVLTTLDGAQHWAYGQAKKEINIESQPALLFEYQNDELASGACWSQLPSTPGINDAPFYQFVDLYGEGLSGVLYKNGQDWKYRSPVRDCSITDNPDAIKFGNWKNVPKVPSLQDGTQMLTDINGDARLDWVSMQPGLNGFFTLNDDGNWQSFSPLSAIPSELLSGEGIFADIAGAGLSDVVVIGPNSVRFYPNTRKGFAPAKTVDATSLNRPLPIRGRDDRTLVAFGDVLGSGQAHLIEVTDKVVYCWPNKGKGRFGNCIELPWNFDSTTPFQPNRLYLVDVDGSGATDLVYVNADKMTLYKNQSGNGFVKETDIALPDGVNFDDTCQLSFVDWFGTGGLSVVFSRSHKDAQHYVLSLTANKPYLLTKINNNCGAISQVRYRLSGQEWLDEKAEDANAVCHLPVPVYLMKASTQYDEITGNQLTQHYAYRGGFYDGFVKVFRGFSYVETLDTDHVSDHAADTDTPPLKTCRWYHTGAPGTLKKSNFWRGDKATYHLNDTYYCDGDGVINITQYSAEMQRWLNLALSGSLLREEVYGLDNSVLKNTPYTVQSVRYRVELVQVLAAHEEMPILRVQQLESLYYQYERVSDDPLCKQTVQLAFDEFSLPTHSVSISYPRRQNISNNVWRNIYALAGDVDKDAQQTILKIHETYNEYIHQNNADIYSLIGLPVKTRTNVIMGSDVNVPQGGFCFERLLEVNSVLSQAAVRHFTGQQQSHYLLDNAMGEVQFPPRVLNTDIAVFDDNALVAYRDVLTPTQLESELRLAGYKKTSRLLSAYSAKERDVWIKEQAFTEYNEADNFFLPKRMQSDVLSGKMELRYDHYCLSVLETVDPLGNSVTYEPNYQQLNAYKIIDSNKNTEAVSVTPLGSPAMNTFYGTENGDAIGFSDVGISSPVLSVSSLIEQANNNVQQQSTLFARDGFSWMADKCPIHEVMLTADNYPNGAQQQQIQIQVMYSDGFGRELQKMEKVPPGKAYQRTNTGILALDANKQLICVHSNTRWRVSGRTEYNNKGLVVRQYQPYFIDDWRYITDVSMRMEGYADTHYYDALGRLIKVVTAKGHERRQYYTPWFSVSEDENDTWADTQVK